MRRRPASCRRKCIKVNTYKQDAVEEQYNNHVRLHDPIVLHPSVLSLDLMEARVEVEVEQVSHEDVREVDHIPVRMMRCTKVKKLRPVTGS